jgi:hypothetical protein
MQTEVGMKRTRRQKLLLIREPNGRAQRPSTDDREFAPTQVKRLRDAALAGMADAEWGTAVGRLYLASKITGPMYAAAKRWTERVVKYHGAINAPPPNPKALAMGESTRGTSPDPDSPEGRQRAVKEAQAITDFLAAHSVLCAAGMIAEATVRNVCERDHHPVGPLENEALNRGLLWLADYWHLTNQRK